MGVYKLKEICQFYNVSADWLLGLTDDDDDDDIVTIKLTREQAKIVKQSINDALK